MDEFAVAAYWGRTAVAGAIVLALGRAALLVARSPATRQRLAAGTLRAAVLVPLLTLLPSWWAITVPAPTPAVVVEAVVAEPVAPPAELPALPVEWATDFEWVEAEAPAFDTVEPPVVVEPEPVVAAAPRQWSWRAAVVVVVAVYAVGVAYLLGVFALGHLALVRLRRGATAAPGRVRAVWGSRRSPALLVHDGLASPVCFGVVRPAVVLPAGLAQSATAEQLAWVLAHEADHLRRGDPLTGWFAGLAKALFFFAPWFWGVRRELRLAQEYLADAAALAAGGHAADYAEFLVDLTAAPVRGRRTLLAHGVRAGRSDLSRRITMVLSTTPPRPARRWATPTAVGLFAVAVALSGVTIVRADNKPTPAEKLNASRLDAWHERAKLAFLQGDLTPIAAPQPPDAPKPPQPPAEAKPARVLEVRPGDWQIQSLDSRNEVVNVNRLRKQIDEALAAGKTDAAKWLIDALVKSLTPPMPGAPTPPAPAVAPLPPVAPMVRGGTIQATGGRTDPRVTAAVEALGKAMETTKDDEARAAMVQAIKLMRSMQSKPGAPTPPAAPNAPKADVIQYGPAFSGPVGGGLFAPAQLPTPNAFSGRGRGPKEFGLVVVALDAAFAEHLQIPAGLVVAEVRPDSPFAKAGVKNNDILTAVGSAVLLNDMEQLRIELSKAQGAKVSVAVISKGVKKTVDVEVLKLYETPTKPKADKVRFETKSVSIANDAFTIEAKAGEVTYKITGILADGKIASYTATITEGKDVMTFIREGDGIVLTEKGQKYKAALVDLLDSVRGQ